MKAGNVFLIILTSIATVIGLIFTKLYEKYVKKNVLVQWALYIFWTLIVFRVLAWVITPFITANTKAMIFKCGHGVKYVFDSFMSLSDTNCGIIIVGLIFSAAVITSVLILKHLLNKIS